jgi:large subunit ribosomal protein L4e
MFAPTKLWRRWHRKINVNQRRFALVSALAASAIPALVMARGHRIDEVNEIPFVLSNVEDVKKTRDALKILARFGVDKDTDRCADSKKVRRGVGKTRNRRYVIRRGPLVVYANKNGLEKAFRNIPGVDLVHVDRLNLLQLAPGGHMGRFVIWTKPAFEKLDALYGSQDTTSELKKDYRCVSLWCSPAHPWSCCRAAMPPCAVPAPAADRVAVRACVVRRPCCSLPRAQMTNADLGRIINSTEVQQALRAKKSPSKYSVHKKNPLVNRAAMARLNPYSVTVRRLEARAADLRAKAKAAGTTKARKLSAEEKAVAKKRRAASKAFYQQLVSDDYAVKA